jgi:hypothetical protein
MLGIIKVLVVLIIGGVAIWVALAMRRAMFELFGEVGKTLDRVTDHSTKSIAGVKDGRKVSALYREKSEDLHETRVECDLPDRPFTLELRPQTAKEDANIAAGKTIDVRVGDRFFDATWVIEGAPADVVRRVLDDSVRQRFGFLLADDLKQPNAGTLRLRAHGKRSSQWLIEAIALLVTIANSIERAYDSADREAVAHAQMTAAPYRGEVRATHVEEARAREFEALRNVRRRRMMASGPMIAALVIAIVAALVVMLRR